MPSASPKKKRGRPLGSKTTKLIKKKTNSDSDFSPRRGLQQTSARKKSKQAATEASAAADIIAAAVREDDDLRRDDVIEEQVVDEVNGDEADDVPELAPEHDVVQHESSEHPARPMQENVLVVLENGEVATIQPVEGDETADEHQYYVEAARKGQIIVANDFVEEKPYASQDQDPTQLCPVCGDMNSGYHYGVYACESCKGFFKRAIQNNRQLRCVYTGNCDITMVTRKRCAACRLRKSLIVGMRVESVRLDRRRGGRSIYIGSSVLPHGRPQRFVKARAGLRPYRSDQLLQAEAGRLFLDIMNLEPQMAEDGEVEHCCQNALTEGDTDVAGSILHLAEHRLYRIIHWARQLPNFSSVDTNDQILLLQNSWASLLAMFMAYQSMDSDNIVMNHGRLITAKLAADLGLGDVYERIEALSESFTTLGLEREEFVALRLLLLVNPDVDFLTDPLRIREYQEQFSEMLLYHLITYRALESFRYTTLLLKLSEIAHIGYLLHEWLLRRYEAYDDTNRPELTGLLVELLKRENTAVIASTGVQTGEATDVQFISADGETLTVVEVPNDHNDHNHALRRSPARSTPVNENNGNGEAAASGGPRIPAILS